MENTTSTSNTPRPQLERAHSGNKTSTRMDKSDAAKSTVSAHANSTAAKMTRHKDKFLAMKERYEQVTATHEQYQRELAIATEKLKNLQNECNLLLDAVDIAVPGQPTLMHYLQHDPVPIHYTTGNVPAVLEGALAPPPHAEVAEHGRPPILLPQQSNGTNDHL